MAEDGRGREPRLPGLLPAQAAARDPAEEENEAAEGAVLGDESRHRLLESVRLARRSVACASAAVGISRKPAAFHLEREHYDRAVHGHFLPRAKGTDVPGEMPGASWDDMNADRVIRQLARGTAA